MAAVPSSVAPSLASAYQPSDQWLSQSADPTGKGPVSTGPSEPISDPVNGTAPVDLNPSPLQWQGPELAEQPPDYFYESVFPRSGPWPELSPEAGDGKEAFGTLPDDGIIPAGYFRRPLAAEGFAQRETLAPGHDRHSQDTDTYGWEQYTPSGRTAVRQYWGQDHLGVEDWWPVTQPNQSRVHVAAGGNQSIGGVVATYGDIANSGGNTVMEPQQPAAVTPQPAGPSGAGTIPQWGF